MGAANNNHITKITIIGSQDFGEPLEDIGDRGRPKEKSTHFLMHPFSASIPRMMIVRLNLVTTNKGYPISVEPI